MVMGRRGVEVLIKENNFLGEIVKMTGDLVIANVFVEVELRKKM